MSWITELEAVYDNTINWEGDKPFPIYHIVNNVAATITLDADGNFIKAEIVDKKTKKDIDIEGQATCMPCTETCATRSSGIDAYPLCDTLEYLILNDAKHKAYFDLLKSWACSDHSNEKIKAVYKYVEGRKIIEDLEKAGLYGNSKKESLNDKDFIRWAVEISGDTNSELWKDVDIQKLWIDFYNSEAYDEYCNTSFPKKDDIEKRIRRDGVNYTDGSNTKIARLHPNKIRSSGDKAKIISSNDTVNYTFRGRFNSADEACQISSDTSQKAHNALRWLINRQGTDVGDGMALVTWNNAGNKLPSIIAESKSFGLYASEPEYTEYQTAKEFANAINKKVNGYFADTSNSNKIMIMCLDGASPTQGRVSIAMYREFENTDFAERLNNWFSRLSWFNSWYDKETKKVKNSIGTPSPKQIAECAYGERVKASRIKKTVIRVLPCILAGVAIPKDIETQCIVAASNLLVRTKRDNVLETACAVYKYNQIILKNEEYQVALEETRTNRDYLFGRLLAVARKLEEDALRKMGAERRDTNAMRYMRQFSLKPFSTWKVLEEKILPYKKHVHKGALVNYEKTIQEICSLFEYDDYTNDKPLSGAYLLGYHCQLKKFWESKKDSSNEDQTDEE